MSAVVVAQTLTKRFGDFTAVNRVTFSIEAGSVWGFLGPNGAGKSTTIRMLCGLLTPTAGSAIVLGMDVATQTERVRQRIGYVSQRSSVWPDLTVVEHLHFYADMYGASSSSAALDPWIRELDLDEYQDVLGAALPQGYRQRLAFACAALHHPEVLFLDEPTAGVDPISRRKFWNLIGSLVDDGATIVVTTHYLDEAEHCDRLAFIDGGSIIAEGTPAALRADASFGYPVELITSALIRALEYIETMPYVRAVTVYGATLHVMLASAAFVDTLSSALIDAHIPLVEIRPVRATLEDVFASVTALRGQAGVRR